MTQDFEVFGRVRLGVHWCMAALLLVQIPLAWYMTDLPLGPTRTRAEDRLFRDAVAARHWMVWSRLLAPGFVADEFAPAHHAMWAWWLAVERGKPSYSSLL